MRPHDPAAYGEAWSGAYDRLYETRDDPASVIVTLERLGPGRDVLDFGLGTGRIAIPLAAAGFHVAGIEASAAMVETFRAKAGAEGIDVVIGDFTATRLERQFDFVLIAFSTLFLLPNQETQAASLVNAAAHLRPGGAVVVEAFVPDHSTLGPRSPACTVAMGRSGRRDRGRPPRPRESADPGSTISSLLRTGSQSVPSTYVRMAVRDRSDGSARQGCGWPTAGRTGPQRRTARPATATSRSTGPRPAAESGVERADRHMHPGFDDCQLRHCHQPTAAISPPPMECQPGSRRRDRGEDEDIGRHVAGAARPGRRSAVPRPGQRVPV